jgi:uncharacterized protein YraI
VDQPQKNANLHIIMMSMSGVRICQRMKLPRTLARIGRSLRLYGWWWPALLLLLPVAAGAATLSEVTILRSNVQMRKGPASYYEVLAAIPENTRLTPLESAMGWYKISYADKSGFISAKAAQPLAAQEDVFSQMATQVVGMKLSSHGMSAGAKGFADRFSKQIKGDPALADEIAAFQIEPAKAAAFTAATYKDVPADYFRKLVKLPPYKVRSAYSYVEQGLGRSIAAKIAAMKLMKDPALIQYVNQVGQLVVSAGAGFDLPFSFFVIDDAEAVNAYACPGGYIFVSRGLLRWPMSPTSTVCRSWPIAVPWSWLKTPSPNWTKRPIPVRTISGRRLKRISISLP